MLFFFYGMDQRRVTITFVGLVFEELGYSVGRMAEESVRAAGVLLRYKGSL